MNEPSASHPTQRELEAFLHGTLNEAERQSVESHVSRCDTCCDLLRGVPHDPLVEKIQAATSSIDDDDTPWNQPPQSAKDDIGTMPTALLDHPRYRILQRLGEGGMGIVYLAEHKLMERPVALKVINARLVSSPLAIERFRQEVKAAAKLAHRNIVAAYDAEQAGDSHFLVMEFIEGISLSELVARKVRLPVLHACNYILQAAQGLQHAHQRGMVHRDIKPHNLMRTPRGTIKILDFGLARFATQQASPDDPGLTADFTALGTPDYMAPEQARDSKRADIRADIYSLGCTFYFLLAGHAPFPTGTAFEKVIGHFERQAKPLSQIRDDIPPEVVQIVERMMDKEPDRRFQSPGEVAEALKPFGRPEGASGGTSTPAALQPPLPQPLAVRPAASSTSRGPQWQPWTDRRLLLGGGGLLAVGLLILFLVGNSGEAPNLPEEREGDTAIDLLVTPAVAEAAPIVDSPANAPPHPAAWVDLIPTIDVSRDTVAGNWQVRQGELQVEAVEAARLMVPQTVPREYDLEVSFTRESGTQSIALHFVSGEGAASFDIDGWDAHLAGIQNIDGRTILENPTRVEDIALENGRTYTAEVRVRRDRVEAYLDGRLLTTYTGDGSNLSLLPLWELPRPAIGLGAYSSQTRFHRFQMRPVSP